MAMTFKDCRFDGSKPLDIATFPTSARADKAKKAEYIEKTRRNTELMGELQDKLYAEGREGLVILFQAMDAAGKDSTIKHVMSGINPQGVDVYSFKTPSKEELAHDYLWRAYTHLPQRGKIALFNRSYYEDVLVVRVRDMRHGYAMPARTMQMDDDAFFDARYRRLAGFEEHLYENGFRVVKFFLNVGLAEQQKRFLERIDDPAKNWKFSEGDLAERALWPAYMDAYEKAINATATEHAPWYVIPADQKWYMRWLVSEAIVDVMRSMDPQYPQLPADQVERLDACKQALLAVEEVEVKTLGKKAAKKAAEKARAKDAKLVAEAQAVAQEDSSAAIVETKQAKKAAKKSDKAAQKASKAAQKVEGAAEQAKQTAAKAGKAVKATASKAATEGKEQVKEAAEKAGATAKKAAAKATATAGKAAAKAGEEVKEAAEKVEAGAKKTAAKATATAKRTATRATAAAKKTAAKATEKVEEAAEKATSTAKTAANKTATRARRTSKAAKDADEQ